MPPAEAILAHWPALGPGSAGVSPAPGETPVKRTAGETPALPGHGTKCRVRPLAAGHINDTYIVDGAAKGRFLLQRLNRAVFPRPEAVMRNLAKALAHEGGRFLVGPVATAQGRQFATDTRGDCWRVFPFVPSRSFQQLPDELVAVTGAAFGRFLTVFGDFSEQLEPVIDGFHDLNGYLALLDAAAKQDEATDELRLVEELRGAFHPSDARQVIHGDCKVNNLLFHPREPTVVAVIDLDTVMLGDPAWDFGDLARSVFAGAEESASAGEFSLRRFELLCHGFAAAFPSIDDCARYAAAPAYMSFMLGVRFLADHLRGDVYFKVASRGQNLLRARSQLRLAERLRTAAPAMEKTLAAALAKAGGA